MSFQQAALNGQRWPLICIREMRAIAGKDYIIPVGSPVYFPGLKQEFCKFHFLLLCFSLLKMVFKKLCFRAFRIFFCIFHLK